MASLSSDPPAPKRKVKDFPPELAWVTDQDRKDFLLVMEVDTNKKSKHFGHDQLVAQSVKVTINDVERVVDLNSLVVDHLRRLCKNLGMTHTGSHSKFEIRKSIATYFQGMENLEQSGITPTTVASRRTSTILRLINVIFSEQFIEDLLKVNDAKSRQDHETFNTHKDFWIRATIAHNSCVDSNNDVALSPPRRERQREQNLAEDVVGDAAAAAPLRPTAPNITNPFATPAANHRHHNPADADNDNPDVDNDDNFSVTSEVAATARQLMGGDSSEGDSHDEDDDNVSKDAGEGDEFSTLVIPENDEFLRPLASDRCINLLEVNQFETQTFRSKVLMLFKMRRTIQQNMSVSGTHNHVVWDFVEGALQKKGSSGITKIALYYFYMRCEEVPDIDSHFQPFMDPSMIGDTSAPLEDDVGVASHQSVVSALSSSGGRKSRNKDGHDSMASSTVAVEAYLEQARNATQAALLVCLNEAAHDRKRKLQLTKKKMGMAERNSRFERRLQSKPWKWHM